MPMDTNRQNELNAILAQCGFVPNPTRTADAHTPVNEPKWEELDKRLRGLYSPPKRPVGRPPKTETPAA